ncbi:Tyrosinase [Dactylellina cionopaga]|nr:Tyrosinase [Dactylellina cionopaga]
MINDKTEFSLFVMALYRLQRQPQNLDTSYYALAGIHGAPYKAWDKVETVAGADPQMGYCAHSDMLFLPWHRPYLALYEQLIWNHARDIVDELPEGDKKNRFAAVLPKLRLPYWDWAASAEIPEEISQSNMIPIETVRHDRESIQNPLFSYWFTDLSEFQNYPWGDVKETVRYPAKRGDTITSQIREINKALKLKEDSWRNRVYQVLTGYKKFESMAKTGFDAENGAQFESLESVHGDVHLAVGANLHANSPIVGHMNPPAFAGFDPIFWLHHNNVDRYFAIWQALNPDGYTFTDKSMFPTYVLPAGSSEDLNTPLMPFRKTETEYWTSADAKDTKVFGYNYPETTGSSKDTLIAINKLYGVGTPSFQIKEAKDGVAKRSIGRRVKRDYAEPNLAPVTDKIIQNTNKYTDWVVNLKVNNAALNGSFAIHVFLKDPSSTDPIQWLTDDNSVGTYGVFADDNSKGQVVTGTIPLTSTLLKRLAANELQSMHPEELVPYFTKNLRFMPVLSKGNTVHQLKDLQDLNIQITAAEVTLPESLADVPKYGKYESKLSFIDVPAGNYAPKAK